jgi:hypothetical protein
LSQKLFLITHSLFVLDFVIVWKFFHGIVIAFWRFCKHARLFQGSGVVYGVFHGIDPGTLGDNHCRFNAIAAIQLMSESPA